MALLRQTINGDTYAIYAGVSHIYVRISLHFSPKKQ